VMQGRAWEDLAKALHFLAGGAGEGVAEGCSLWVRA